MTGDSYEEMKGKPFDYDYESLQHIEKILRKEISKLTPEQIKQLFLGEP